MKTMKAGLMFTVLTVLVSAQGVADSTGTERAPVPEVTMRPSRSATEVNPLAPRPVISLKVGCEGTVGCPKLTLVDPISARPPIPGVTQQYVVVSKVVVTNPDEGRMPATRGAETNDRAEELPTIDRYRAYSDDTLGVVGFVIMDYVELTCPPEHQGNCSWEARCCPNGGSPPPCSAWVPVLVPPGSTVGVDCGPSWHPEIR